MNANLVCHQPQHMSVNLCHSSLLTAIGQFFPCATYHFGFAVTYLLAQFVCCSVCLCTNYNYKFFCNQHPRSFTHIFVINRNIPHNKKSNSYYCL